MITLEQIQLLDQKVKKAVDLIDHLKRENSSLRGKLGEYEKRIGEMEQLFTQLKSDQEIIEDKIRHALSQLDKVEDEIIGKKEPAPATQPETTAAAASPQSAERDEPQEQPVSMNESEDLDEEETLRSSSDPAELDIF